MNPTCSRALAITLLAGSVARADVSVFPTSAHTIYLYPPFGVGTAAAPVNTATTHLVYAASLFSGPSGGRPVTITDIGFAVNTSGSYASGITLRMGYTNRLPGAPSTGSGLAAPSGIGGAPNAVGPMTIVYSNLGYVVATTGPSSTNFGELHFPVQFTYDPALGNLLIEVSSAATAGLSIDQAVSQATGSPQSSLSYASTRYGAAERPGDALRVQFMFDYVRGACCLGSTLACAELSLGACTAQGGTYRGDGTICATANCPTPGACCLPASLGCVQTNPSACLAQGGIYQGDSTACATSCPTPGACCLPHGNCIQTTPTTCASLQGVYSGQSVGCDTIACGGPPSFTPLGFLSSYTASDATAISGDGSTVVGIATLGTLRSYWWWRQATGVQFVSEAYTGSSWLRAPGVSRHGEVVVGTRPNRDGFRYTTASGTLTLLPRLGSWSFVAHCVSADGLHFGGGSYYGGTGGSVPNPLTGDTTTTVEVPSLPNTGLGVVNAMTANGAILVGGMYDFAFGTGPAFLWSQATGPINLGHLIPPSSGTGNYQTYASAVSADGSVVVGYSPQNSRRPFIWTQASGIRDLSTSILGSAEASGISADGSIVVGGSSNNTMGAFVWDQSHGPRSLKAVLLEQGVRGELISWNLTYARGTSEDGRAVVGVGIDGQGRTQAFLARLNPSTCYANCDGSTAEPRLNIADFICFINRYSAGEPGANCDASTTPPTLNVNDYFCFLFHFNLGC
ncbi:MAG: hypothetical protein ACKVW3_08525 [Phycisphaerales bacterium]